MAFPPPADRGATGGVKCGNAGQLGEHRQKRARNGRFLECGPDACGVESAPVIRLGNVATASPGAVTELLRAWSDGDERALERLVPLVEAELRRLARGYMGRERRGHTLQVTALVNEAFLRLTGARQLPWQDRAHFLGISARLMRRVLVDHARARGYQKRGGRGQRVTLDDALVVSSEPAVQLLDLDRALEALAATDPRKTRVIELRFFGGLSVEETAEVLHVSTDTVKRDWRLAKLWLLRELEGDAR
jgi:RNA polymerase sigma factor (TIGR02999 family)